MNLFFMAGVIAMTLLLLGGFPGIAQAEEIEILDAWVSGGSGFNDHIFWVDGETIFNMRFEIIGDPAALYKVVGVAYSDYKYCVRKRAEKVKEVGYFGTGKHTISFKNRIRSCVFPPPEMADLEDDREWVKVKWRIKLKTEDGATLLDLDKLRTSDAFCVYYKYNP
jgi:hypothetical protein